MKLNLNTADVYDEIPSRRPQKIKKKDKPRLSPESTRAELTSQGDNLDYLFTYNASRHERGWLMGSLGAFYEQAWFVDVLKMVKGGKEASVYLCEAHPNTGTDYLAAKVYRPRMLRNLKNDQIYREGRVNLDSEGREIRDERIAHAMMKKTSFGKQILHTSWIAHEVKTLQTLHNAGCDVPRVYASGNNAILMDYIGDLDLPAPTLSQVHLKRNEAGSLFHRVVSNIELMLANRRIHGDLSAYNILYWDGEITLIDFPQAIDPDDNRSAFRIFERDVIRICEYFLHQGVRCDGHRLARDLWHAQQRRILPEVDPALLNSEDEGDIDYWRKMQTIRE
jgi:RIO kinase 1